MKKILTVGMILSILLVFSCASGGGKPKSNPRSMEGLGDGTLAVGEWYAYNDQGPPDNGSSTSVLTSAQEVIDGQTVTTYTVKGNVTSKFQYGFAGWGIEPDAATLELLKNAKAIAFTILGDGKKYTIKYKTSDVKDYAYHEYHFNTEAGKAMTFEVPMGFFMQPSWTNDPVKLRAANVIGFEFQTHESWRPNTFEIKTWNVKIY